MSEEKIQNIMGEKFALVSHEIERTLPPIDYGFGYGSGVIPQVGYEYSSESYPLVDVILVVKNIREWHRDNLRENARFYNGNY